MTAQPAREFKLRSGARCMALLMRFFIIAMVLGTLSGCATKPPSGWFQGGSRLTIPRARWVNGAQTVELGNNGRVIVSGTHWITIDEAGRAYDDRNEAIALLRPDGMLLGRDDKPLGWVGAGQTMKPGGRTRWLTFRPSGEVLKNDGGDVKPFGVWLGCNQVPYTLQACALVTHLIARSWWQLQRLSYNNGGPLQRNPGFTTPFTR